MDQLINFASWVSLKLGINVNLIVIGLEISYLSWITKRGYEYIGQKSIENGGGSLDEKSTKIHDKLENNEKLTKTEQFNLGNWHAKNFAYALLQGGIYLGYIVSFIGLIVLLINK
jgi:hypothetical protein